MKVAQIKSPVSFVITMGVTPNNVLKLFDKEKII